MKNSIVLMLLLVISNVAHADISFTEQEIPKVIANNGYEFTVPYFELETPFGITAYTVKLIAPSGQLTFSVDLSTLQEVTLKPRVSTKSNDCSEQPSKQGGNTPGHEGQIFDSTTCEYFTPVPIK